MGNASALLLHGIRADLLDAAYRGPDKLVRAIKRWRRRSRNYASVTWFPTDRGQPAFVRFSLHGEPSFYGGSLGPLPIKWVEVMELSFTWPLPPVSHYLLPPRGYNAPLKSIESVVPQ